MDKIDTLPEKTLSKYYRRDPQATETAITAFLRDSQNPQLVVYGTRAVNAYLPAWLDRATKDWDIYSSKSAKTMATELEQKLDKHYGGDFFAVEPAVHRGTFRVRSKVTGETVADITLARKMVSFRRIGGINYAALEVLEEQAKGLLDNPDAAYRHRKDKDTLQRITVYRADKTKKQKKRKRDGSESLAVFSI